MMQPAAMHGPIGNFGTVAAGGGNLINGHGSGKTITPVVSPIALGDGNHRLIDNEVNAVITGGAGNNQITELGTGVSITLGNGNNTIMDATQFGRLLGQGPDAAIVLDYAEHPAVKGLEGQATVFKAARSVTKTKAVDTAVTTTELAFSAQRSWGETKVEQGDWQWNDGEMRGPVPLMASSTKATRATLSVRLLHAWLVPRWTSTSPAFAPALVTTRSGCTVPVTARP